MVGGSSPLRIPSPLLALIVLLAVPLVAISAVAEEAVPVAWAPELGGPGPPDRPTAAEVIASMYSKAEAMLAGSGHDVAIAVDGFRHLSSKEMGQVPWLDLVTAEGPQLALGTHFFGLAGVDERLVHVSAVWRDPQRRSASETHPGLTALAAARILDQPGFGEEIGGITPGRTVALSSYRVHLGALGEWRDYRAAVIWRQLEDGSYAAIVQDHVLAIDQIIWLEESPSRRLELDALEASLGDADDVPTGPLAKAVCTPTSGVNNGSLQIGARTIGHRTGWHIGSFALRASHSCDVICRARCDSRLQSENCVDSGGSFVNLEVTSHKPFVASDTKSESSLGSAKCVGAFQCAFSECKGAICPGISVGVSILGSGANFSNASGAVDKFNLQDSYSISCAPAPPPPTCPTQSTTTKVLTLAGQAAVPPPDSPFTLDRVERSDVFHHGARVSYVLDEWALFEHRPGLGTTLERTSSLALAEARGAMAAEVSPQLALAKNGASPQPILLVEAPFHPENDRAIPLPSLTFDRKALPVGLPRGRMIVRLDVDDDRRLQDLTVIYDSFGGTVPELRAAIEERFGLEFVSDQQHRVVTYAVLDVGDSITVVDHVSVLPKCCPICPPRDPYCVEP